MSRGAKRAIFIELDRRAVGIIKKNLEETGLAEFADVFGADVLRSLKIFERKNDQFDIIYLGAPYDSPALDKALEKVGEGSLLNSSAIVIAEHRKQHQVLDGYGILNVFREAKYGETVFTFYESRNIPG